MGRVIDDRVVEMRFDNKDFEKNVSQSLSTLDKLKNALKIGNSASSEFDSVMDAAGDLGSKFGTLENITVGAFRKMGESIYDWAAKTAVNLSGVGNIIEGWKKYETITDSMATLHYQGFTDDETEAELKRLNWFTDETSYNLSDMVNNISKFTASGKGLHDSADAMMGIALWAASAGQQSGAASRAMYQLSQAIGRNMKLEDWKSIQNLNMDTRDFREAVLATAVDMQTLKKNSDGTYRSLVATTKAGQQAFSVEQFADSLTQGQWFTSDVQMAVYKKYSGAVDAIYKYYEAHQGEAGIDTVSDVVKIFREKKLVDEWALSAFEAAQEARTWAQVVDSVKDALSTGWMNVFQRVFGYYGDAKEFFTELANDLYIFVEPVNALSDLLDDWADLGGRDDFIEGLIGVLRSFLNILEMIGGAFSDVFGGQGAVNSLLRFSAGFKAIGKGLENISEHTKMLKYTLEGVFAIVNIIWTIATSVLRAVLSLFSGISTSVGYLNEGIFALTGGIGILLVKLSNLLKSSDIFYKVFSFILLPVRYLIRGITWLIETIGGVIPSVLSALKSFFISFGKVIGNALSNTGKAMKQYFKDLLEASGSFGKDIVKFFSSVGEKIRWLVNFIKTADYDSIFSSIGKNGVGAASNIAKAWEKVSSVVGTFFENFKEWTFEAAKNLGAFWDNFSPKLKKVLANAKSVLLAFYSWFKNNFGGFWGLIKKIFGEIGKFFSKISKGISSFIKASDFEKPKKILMGFWTVIKVIALGIGAVFYGLYKLLEPILGDLFEIFRNLAESITLDSIGNALKGIGLLLTGIGINKIGGFFSGLTETLNNFSGMLKGDPLKNAAKAILILALSLFLLAQVPFDQLVDVSVQFTTFMGVLAGGLAILANNVGAKEVYMIGKGLQALCIGVLGLAAALWIIAKIPQKPLFVAASVLAGLMLVAAVSVAIIAKFWPKIESGAAKIFKKKEKGTNSKPKKMAGTILALGLSIVMIAVALRIVSKISPDKMTDTLIAFAAIVGGLGLLILAIGAMNKLSAGSLAPESAGKTIMKLAEAMLVIALALKLLSTIDDASLSIGLEAMLDIVIAMVILMSVTAIMERLNAKNGGVGEQVGASILKTAISMLLIAFALKMLCDMDQDSLLSGLWKFAIVVGLLAALIVAIGFAEKMAGGVGKGVGQTLIRIAIAMYLFIGAIAIFAAMEWDTLLKGGGILIGFMAILIALGAIAGIPLVARGLYTIADAFLKISLATLILGVGLVALKIAFNALYKILYKIKPVVMALVEAFVSGMMYLVEWLPGIIVTLIVGLLQSLAENMGTLVLGILEAIATFLEALTSNGALARVLDALFNLITIILEALESHIGEWVELLANIIFDIVLALIQAIRDRIGEYADALLGLIVDVIEGVATAIDNNAQDMVDAIEHLKIAILRFLLLAITGGYVDLYDAGGEGGNQTYEGFKAKVDEVFSTISTWLYDHLVKPIADTFKSGSDAIKKLISVGEDILGGIWQGLKDAWDDVKDWFSEKLGALWDLVCTVLDIHSPSRVMAYGGRMIAEGLGVGIKDGFSSPMSEMDTGCSGLLEGFKSYTQQINDVLNTGIDSNPTITPVLDLTNLKSGASSINGMFGGLDLGSGKMNLAALASGFNMSNEGFDPNNPNSGRMVFNQYNYSPKALSATEIYRQTRNQLSGAKGVVIQKR